MRRGLVAECADDGADALKAGCEGVVPDVVAVDADAVVRNERRRTALLRLDELAVEERRATRAEEGVVERGGDFSRLELPVEDVDASVRDQKHRTLAVGLFGDEVLVLSQPREAGPAHGDGLRCGQVV